MIKLIIHGLSGKMGQMLVECAEPMEDVEIVAGVDIIPPPVPPKFPFFSSLEACNLEADVVLDFTRADSLPGLLAYARRTGVRPVIATTGHTSEEAKAIQETSKEVAVFHAANMSLGVNVLAEMTAATAKALKGFDVEIVEHHHNTKVDAPSGTALMLANVVNEQNMGQMEYIYERHSRKQRRSANEIGMHAIRGGTVAGEHEVIFAGPDEIVTLSHKAYSRRIFAQGALRAALFVSNKPAGLYTVTDLFLEKASVTHLLIDRSQSMLTVSQLRSDTLSVAQIFAALAEANINVDMISQTAPMGGMMDVSFTLPQTDVAKATEILQTLKTGARLESATDIIKLTVSGPGMANQSGVAANVLMQLGRVNVQVRLITTAETQISMCMDKRNEEKAVSVLKEAFGI